MTKSLREQVERSVLDFIPEGKTSAVLGIQEQDGTVRTTTIAGAVRVGDHVKLGGDLSRKWGGKTTGRVMVVGAW